MVAPLEQGCAICSTSRRPQEAEQGLLCDRCSNDLLKLLNDVELCLLAVSAVPSPKPSASGPIARAKSESKSPANDTAIVHLDPRSAYTEEDGPGAFAVLIEWASLAREVQGVQQPRTQTIVSEAKALRVAHRDVCSQDWVVEYQDELKSVYGRLRHLCGLEKEREVGECPRPDCSGRVYSSATGGICRHCDTEYRGLALASMRQEVDREATLNRVPVELAVKALADYGKPVSSATLRKWVQRGHISGGDGYDMLEILEYVNRSKM